MHLQQTSSEQVEIEKGFMQAQNIGPGGSVLEPVLVELASLALHILDHSQHLRTFAACLSLLQRWRCPETALSRPGHVLNSHHGSTQTHTTSPQDIQCSHM